MAHNNIRIAICKPLNETVHSTSWIYPWIEYCEENNLDYELIDCLQQNIIQKLRNFNVLLWHFSGFNLTEMTFARSILYTAKQMGLGVFPDYNDCWHFDDKVAESYLLESINAKMPSYTVLYTMDDIKLYANDNHIYPVIVKLRNGSGAHNVKKINNKDELIAYAQKMFSKGINSSPDLIFKASSNIKSAHSINTYIKRAKRIPEFLRNMKKAQEFPNEKGYVYIQEFIENEGYDLKIVVVKDKLSFVVRPVRKGDFRASGGGALLYDKTRIPANVLQSAFETSDKLGLKCMGYDFVVDKKSEEGKIVEMSYGFSHMAILGSGGYFDRNGQWHNQPFNPPKDVLVNLLQETDIV